MAGLQGPEEEEGVKEATQRNGAWRERSQWTGVESGRSQGWVSFKLAGERGQNGMGVGTAERTAWSQGQVFGSLDRGCCQDQNFSSLA